MGEHEDVGRVACTEGVDTLHPPFPIPPPSFVLSSGSRFLPFSLLCYKLVTKQIDGFPEFCELGTECQACVES